MLVQSLNDGIGRRCDVARRTSLPTAGIETLLFAEVPGEVVHYPDETTHPEVDRCCHDEGIFARVPVYKLLTEWLLFKVQTPELTCGVLYSVL